MGDPDARIRCSFYSVAVVVQPWTLMLPAHLFCGSCFVLEIPMGSVEDVLMKGAEVEDVQSVSCSSSACADADASLLGAEGNGSWNTTFQRRPLREDFLLRIQQELFQVLSTSTRFKLYQTYAPAEDQPSVSEPGQQVYNNIAGDPSHLFRVLQHVGRTGCGLSDPSKGWMPRRSMQQPPTPPSSLTFVSPTSAPPVSLKHSRPPPGPGLDGVASKVDIEDADRVTPAAKTANQAPYPIFSLAELALVAQAHASPSPMSEERVVPAPSSGLAVYTPDEAASIAAHFAQHHYRPLHLTDSRVAEEIYWLCLRRGSIALPHQCRLYATYKLHSKASRALQTMEGKLQQERERSGSHRCASVHGYGQEAFTGAVMVKPQIEALIRRREALQQRHNLDEDLLEALTEGWKDETNRQQLKAVYEEVTKELLERVGRRAGAQDGAEGNQLLSPAMLHERHVSCVLRYAERHVTYAAVLNEEEQASPFLLALGLLLPSALHTNPAFAPHTLPIPDLLSSPLTLEDLVVHVLRHPRRLVQALGLYVARYTLPPEEMPLYFFLALGEEVSLAVAPPLTGGLGAGGAATLTLAELAKALLLQEDVSEAWLPPIHSTWRNGFVEPVLLHMSAFWASEKQRLRAAAQAGVLHTAGLGVVDFAMRAALAATTSAAPTSEDPLPPHRGDAAGGLLGKGKGVSRLGFRNLRDVIQFAKSAAQPTRARSIEVLLSSRYMLPATADEAPQRRPHKRSREEANQEGQVETDTLVTHRRHVVFDDAEGMEDAAKAGPPDVPLDEAGECSDNDEDDADFLIRVQVEDSVLPAAGPAGAWGSSSSTHHAVGGGSRASYAIAQQQKHAEAEAEARATANKVQDLHKQAQVEGYRQLMRLMGRTQPFDKRCEHTIEF
eukprot:gene13433-9244_t